MLGLETYSTKVRYSPTKVPERSAKGTTRVSWVGTNSVGPDEGYERSSRVEAARTKVFSPTNVPGCPTGGEG